MPLHFDEETMRAEVLKHIQIGARVEDAQKIMQDHGFKCRVEESWMWSVPGIDTATYLCGSRIKPQENRLHQGIVLDEILIYMPIEAGTIKAVKVRHDKISM